MEAVDVRGRFVWHELMTRDVPGAKKFYSGLTGWKPQAWPLDPTYTVNHSAHGPQAGFMNIPADMPAEMPAHWVTYIGTRDVDGTAAAAVRAGGSILKGPDDIKGADRTDVTIALKRANGQNTSSTIHLIAPANITKPAMNANVTWGDGTPTLDLAWTKADGTTASFFIYPCGSVAIASRDTEFSDTGTASLPVTKLVGSKPTGPTCITIRLDRRSTDGKVDPAWHSGSTLDQARYDHVDVNVVP